MVNATQYQVFNKSGVSVFGPAIFGNLWPAGDICRSNTGDPIVVYDHLADRWLLSQFAFPSHMCIAISQTPSPAAGSWFLYTFNVGTFPDYPKFGVWPDGYYMTSFEGSNLGVFVFDRANMLLGNAAASSKEQFRLSAHPVCEKHESCRAISTGRPLRTPRRTFSCGRLTTSRIRPTGPTG